MKYALLVLMFSSAAYADHSLYNAMQESADVRRAVATIESDYGVICNTQVSDQSYYFPEEQGKVGTAWTQKARCYNSFRRGEYYGLRGEIVVSYTWTADLTAGKVRSFYFQE